MLNFRRPIPLILVFIVHIFILQAINAGAQHALRPLADLVNKQEPAWPDIQQLIKGATNQVTVLPKDNILADSALFHAQITTRSPMGAVVYETGGILIDSGWVRILGSGCKSMTRDLMGWNKGKSFSNYGEAPKFLLIADDVIGGFYAINAGGISAEGIGKVFYLAPDDLEWQNLDIGYGQFLTFCFTGDLKKFYEGFQWNGWAKEVQLLGNDQAFSIYPYLCTKEGADITKDSRKPAPVQEIWQQAEYLKKMFGH